MTVKKVLSIALLFILSAIAITLVLCREVIDWDGHFKNPEKYADCRLNICYVPGAHPSPSQMLDLYLPKGSTGPVPVVVWIHGGCWLLGDKAQGPFVPLLKHGYAVASLNYRFSSEALFPAQIEDCREAIAYLRKNARSLGIDPNHIGVWGFSAGGHLAAMLGTTCGGSPQNDGSAVQCVIDSAGVTDMRYSKALTQNQTLDLETDKSCIARLLGGVPKLKPKEAEAASPVAYVKPGVRIPPFLIIHGDADDVVPLQQSRILYEALRSKGDRAFLIVMPNARHWYSPGSYGPKVLRFLDAYLK